LRRLNACRPGADHLAMEDNDFFASSPSPTPANVPIGGQFGPPTGPPIGGQSAPPTGVPFGGVATMSRYSPSGRLGFMNSIKVGFQLLPVCWSVLMQAPNLLVVPLLVLVAGTLSVFGYSQALGGFAHLVGPNKYATAVRVFPLEVLIMAMSVVGQAVIVAAATDVLSGRRTSLSTAWRTTVNQLPRLVLFGIVYAAERTLTSLLRGRRWSVGTLAANTIDRAWDFATFLAIPVLLYEDVPVFRAVKRSGTLVAKRWGVQLTARSVLGFALFIVVMPLLIVGGLLMSVSEPAGFLVIVGSLLAMFAMSGALTGVLSAALYRFGTTGEVGQGFDESEMWAVFSRR
jgi:hypothetical protein